MAKKKIKHTPAEIENDRSLKYHPYQRGELVRCDDRNGFVRFWCYTDDSREFIQLSMDLAMGEPAGRPVPATTVRRPNRYNPLCRVCQDNEVADSETLCKWCSNESEKEKSEP